MKFKRFLKSPILPVILFVAAAALLVTGGIGGTRAALTQRSETYTAEVEMLDIGTAIVEKSADGAWVATETLCANLLGEDKTLKLGKEYPEELAVANNGSIDEYVRVNVYKYWLDEKGNKVTNLSPELIGLNFANVGGSWIEDTSASTDERTVLYYTGILAAGSQTEPFTDKIVIDDSIASKVHEEYSDGGATVTTVYAYDGYSFVVEAEVNAVQTHNAEAAILSAWGKNVTISGGSITSVG